MFHDRSDYRRHPPAEREFGPTEPVHDRAGEEDFTSPARRGRITAILAHHWVEPILIIALVLLLVWLMTG